MMDLKGASANRVVLILVIMTLHSFGEGSGVGVSFAGPRGLSQGLLVTIAIAVHNVPEGLAMTLVMVARGVRPRNAMLWSVFTSLPQPLVAVPAFLGANTFTQFLPLCMGFAAGCMIWIVFGEVLPECIKEGANSSHVASAATLSVAFMEALGTFLEGVDAPESWHRLVPIAWALLFFLGPLIGSVLPLLLSHSLPAPVSPPLLSGLAGGALLGLALWQPVQLLVTGQMEVLPLLSVFYVGCVLHYFCASMGRGLADGCVGNAQQKLQGGFSDVQYSHGLQQWTGDGDEKEVRKPSLQLSYGIRASVLVCVAVSGHAFAEGLLLGQKAAPGGELGGESGASGLGGGGVGEIGMRMLLPAAIHGVPRGIAAAAAALGSFSITRSTPELPLAAVPLALASAAVAGLAGPVGAVASFFLLHSFGKTSGCGGGVGNHACGGEFHGEENDMRALELLATVTGVNAVSTGISKACKHYADLHEREKIESMRKAGKRPEDVIFAALQRLLHLEMAGYHHEVAAVSQKIASKLGTADDRSSVEHQTLQALSRTLVEACRQHGMDVTPSVKGGRLGFQGLEDFLNSSRMGTDHYDCDKLVTDLYFAFLFAQDIAQGNIQRIEAAFNEAVERLISGPARDCLSPVSPLSPASTGSAPSPGKSVGGFSSGCVRAASANDLPAYARPDAFKLPQAPPKPTSFFSATTTTSSSSSSSSNGGKWGSSPSPASGQAGNKPAPLVGIGTEDDKT
ncbi:unnamed protein product [Closterium sp. Yama58-4]|nr:unnamed protein product [Closterium sp. Yama58-4]